MKRKVVKMGLALVMSVALLAGCGGSSEAENFKNDLKAFAALEGVDNTDFEAMSKAVEELNLNTDEGKAIKDDLQEVVEYTKKAMEATTSGEAMDAEAITKLQEDVQAMTEKKQKDLESFIKAAADSGIDESDLEGLAGDLGL